MPYEAAPTRPEVEAQLQRMLKSRIFARADKQSKLLSYIVENQLNSREITEKTIGFELFQAYDPESTVIRTTAVFMRAKIKTYYETIGVDDLVKIECPPGDGYNGEFTYHTRSIALMHHRRGLAYRNMPSLNSIYRAEFEFDDAQSAAPSYAPAYAEAAETYLVHCVLGEIVQGDGGFYDFAADEEAERGLMKCGDHWKLYLVQSIVSALRDKWNKAGKEMAKALAENASLASENLWYACYILTLGHAEEAITIAKANVNRYPDSFYCWLVYALFLYVTRSFEQAQEALRMGAFDSGDLPIYSILGGLILIALGDYERALTEYTHLERFRGFKIECLVATNNFATAEDELRAMERESYPDLMQLAVAHIALGNHRNAIECLTMGKERARADPFFAWLNLWPFLDALRGFPDFQSLL